MFPIFSGQSPICKKSPFRLYRWWSQRKVQSIW